MTAKEYLSQVYILEQKIKRKQMRAEEYKQLASSTPSINYDGIRVDGTRNLEAPFVKWVGKLIDIQEEIKNLQTKLDLLKDEIIGVIETLDNEDYKTLLVLRYLNCKPWEDIADKLYTSLSTVKRWHTKALVQIKIPS